jgi:hypothetical protein
MRSPTIEISSMTRTKTGSAKRSMLDVAQRRLSQQHHPVEFRCLGQIIENPMLNGEAIRLDGALAVGPAVTPEELKSVPFVPRSHPFIERLIGTLRREYLGQTFFWNGLDLHRKLNRFAAYYNQWRVHAGLGGRTPFERCCATAFQPPNLQHFA